MRKLLIYGLVVVFTLLVAFLGFFGYEKYKKANNIRQHLHAKWEKPEGYNEINQLLDKSGLSGTVTILKDGKLIYQAERGYADYKKQKPLNDKNMFLIGSANKLLTGVLVKRLVDEKKIDINLPVSHYITNFGHDEITVNDLIKHESGLTRYKPPMTINGLDASVQTIIQSPFDSRFHHKFYYSDGNYILLAKIVENITHQTFQENMRQTLFEPMKLQNTMFFDAPNLTAHRVEGMNIVKGNLKRAFATGLDKYYGAGNIYMSGYDFAQVINNLNNQHYFDYNHQNLPKYQYGFYNKQGYKRTRGYFYGTEFIAWFNQDKIIVLTSNIVDTSNYKKNENLVKQIYTTL
ncbi:serine hydrolase domain-containing protein [Macrococcus capreoli]